MNNFEKFYYTLFVVYVLFIRTILLKFVEINLFLAKIINEIAHNLLDLSKEMIDLGMNILNENKYFKLFR